MDRRSWVLLWGLAAVWGGSYLLIKFGLDAFEPMTIVSARLVLAAAVLLTIAHRRGALAPLRGRLAPLVLLAVVQVAAPLSMITFGELHVASGLTGILVASSPLFTVLLILGGFGTADRIGGWGVVGVLVGLAGVGLLFGADLTGSAVGGGALILCAALGYAIGPLFQRRRFGDVAPVGLAAGTMSVSALATLPFGLAGLPAADPAPGPVLAIVVLGVVGTGAAFLVMYTLISSVGAPRAATVAYLAPGFSVAYGAVFGGEAVTPTTVAGLALVLAGSWVAAAGRVPWRRRVPAPA